MIKPPCRRYRGNGQNPFISSKTTCPKQCNICVMTLYNNNAFVVWDKLIKLYMEPSVPNED